MATWAIPYALLPPAYPTPTTSLIPHEASLDLSKLSLDLSKLMQVTRACEALLAIAPSLPSNHSEAFKVIAAVFRDTVGGRLGVLSFKIQTTLPFTFIVLPLFQGSLTECCSLGPIVSVFFVRAARSLVAASDASARAFAAAMMEGCEGITRCFFERCCVMCDV